MQEQSLKEAFKELGIDIELEDDVDQDQEKVSVWIKEKNLFIPSTDISLHSELPPGLYQVDFTNDRGLYAKPIDLKVDELYTFSDSITEDLLSEVSSFWKKADLYKRNKLIHKRGILLAGNAGVGKSSYINMLSKELINNGGVVFKIINIRGFQFYLDFIQHGFRKIQPDTPIITILEDIDKYLDIETELLDFLDGQFHLDHHVVLATSNNTEELPDTFLRPSRLDLLIEVPNPSETTRREYFEKKNVDPDLIDELVEKSNEFSFADLKELYICVFVLDFTIDDSVERIINKTTIKRNYLKSKSSRIEL